MDFAGSVRGFWEFVALRQDAYWEKEHGNAKSHFRDPIMAQTHFTNVFRELDAGTVFFQKKLAEDVDRLRPKTTDLLITLWRSLTYRPINRKQTFVDFGWPSPGQEASFTRTLWTAMRDRGYPTFTGRHLTMGIEAYQGLLTAIEQRGIAWPLELVVRAKSLKDVYLAIRENLPGMGSFFSWQVTCDLLESKVLPFGEDDWVKLGPGAVKGLQLMHCRSIRSVEQLPMATKLRDSQQEYLERLNFKFPDHPTRFTLKNVEHALCEYSRYVVRDWYR